MNLSKNYQIKDSKLNRLKLKAFNEFYRYIVYNNKNHQLDIFVTLFDFNPNNDSILIHSFSDFLNVSIYPKRLKFLNKSHIKRLNRHYKRLCKDDDFYYNIEIYKLFLDFFEYINGYTDYEIECVDTYFYIIKKMPKSGLLNFLKIKE